MPTKLLTGSMMEKRGYADVKGMGKRRKTG